MTEDDRRIGERLRELRRLRGLTQQRLASDTHFSLSLVKKVEQGSAPPSAAFVASAARVLRIRPDYLYGDQQRELAGQPAVEAAGIAELRVALDGYDDPRPDGRPLSRTVAVRRLADIGRDVYGLRYRDAARALAVLLPHLYRLGQQGEPGRAALHDGYRIAASVAGQFRQADLAAIATERHVALAPLTGDPLRVAISAYHRTSRHLQNGDFDLGLRILDRAHQYLGDRPADRAVAVQLHLRAAVLAARGGDRIRADEHVDLARAIADRYHPPDTPYYNVDASRLNIDAHWCAVPVENYDGTAAVERGRQVRISDPDRPERVGHHHIDQARAWLLHGDRRRALAQLNAARRVAAERIRHHPQVRATVLALAQDERRTNDSLASFARWAGVPV